MSDTAGTNTPIQGTKVRNPTKAALAADIAVALGLDAPPVSNGSSVDSTFLDRIHTALTGDKSTATDAYRKAERVLQDLGLTYDPFWDTSESSPTGGSTVTNRAYSRIRSAVTGRPRCFLLSVTDADVGAQWETDHQEHYRYGSNVTAHRPLNDAGPGSRIIYYATGKSKDNPRHFIAHAEITYIASGWDGPWEATISGYTDFERPVPEHELSLPGWNKQHSLTEVTYGTYQAILAAAGTPVLAESTEQEQDPGGDVVAKRVLEEIPPPATPPSLSVPDTLPTGELTSSEAAAPTYTESEDGDQVASSDLPRTPKNTARNKLAETRAVDLVKQALAAQGWTLKKDRQKDGVGYDLQYVRDARELHVEVKGIISNVLAFNLTPKEAWRVETDPAFVVIAVTNVLSPTAFELHLMDRTRLSTAPRVITGYRLRF